MEASAATERRVLARPARWGLNLLLMTVGVVILGYLLITLRIVVIPVVVALFVTTILFPVKEWLRRRGSPGWLASLTVLVTALALVVLIVTLLAPRVTRELGALGTSVQEGFTEVGASLAGGPLGITQADIDRTFDQAVQAVQQNSGAITRGFLSGAVLVGEIVAGLLLVIVITFFLLKDGDRIWRWAVGLFPAGRTQRDVTQIGRRAWHTLTEYIRGVAVVATIDSVFIGLGLAILGVPLVLPLAVLTFFAAFLPLIGAFTAGLIAVLVALVSKGIVAALIVLAIIVAVQQIEGHVIYPVVVGRAIEVHPLAILLSVAAGAIAGGIVGALLAPPAAAVAWSVIAYLRSQEGRPGLATGAPAPDPTGSA